MTISMDNMTTHKKRTMLKGIKLENNDNQSANKKKKKTEKNPRQVQNMDYAVRLFFPEQMHTVHYLQNKMSQYSPTQVNMKTNLQ